MPKVRQTFTLKDSEWDPARLAAYKDDGGNIVVVEALGTALHRYDATSGTWRTVDWGSVAVGPAPACAAKVLAAFSEEHE